MIGLQVQAQIVSNTGETQMVNAYIEGTISPRLFRAFYVDCHAEDVIKQYLEQLVSHFGENVLNENWVYLSLEDGSYIYTPESRVA